jgi:2-keto-4-pentenoate hydratase
MSEPADALLEELIAARAGNGLLVPPSARQPLGTAEAYAIQDRLRGALLARGERVVGWKTGFTSAATQSMFDTSEPVSGFLLASGVFPSGALVPTARFTSLAVEAEVAFVMRHDLAGPGVTLPRALLAVEGVLPALELIDMRYAGKAVASDLVADGVSASAIVLGSALTPISTIDLTLEGLVYELNGAVAATNTAAEVLGNPLISLVWLANHLGTRGLGLRAGDVVMSGSISTLLRPKAGDTVRASFTRLGTVSARFA